MKEPLFIVRFQDDQARYETRHQYLNAHLEWLDNNSEQVLVGGSLREEPHETPVGGLWIVNVVSRKVVKSLINTDPFWQHNLRRSVDILYWSKAFSNARSKSDRAQAG